MVLQTHLQCQIISISPGTKYKHHSTTILDYINNNGCTATTYIQKYKEMPTIIYSDNKQFTKHKLQMQQEQTKAHSTSTTNLEM